MVDCPAPVSRTKGNGPRPSMQTLTDSADLPGHRAHRQRDPLRPTGQRGHPAAPGGGGRQGERHLGLHVDRRSAVAGPADARRPTPSASTVAPMATMAAISQPRRVGHGTDLAAEREPAGGQRHAHAEHEHGQGQRGPPPALRRPAA